MTTTSITKSKGFVIKEPIFHEDSRIVSILTELKVSYEIASVSISDIDLNDIECQTRLNVSHASPESIQRYNEDLSRGDDFPMVVLAKRRDGKFRIIGGNHRIRAIALGGYAGSFEAMVLGSDVSKDLLCVISARDNASLGNKTHDNESLAIAIRTLVNTPLQDEEQQHSSPMVKSISNKMRVPYDLLRNNYQAAIMRNVIKSAGIDFPAIGPGSNHVSLLVKLWSIWTRTQDMPVVSAVAQAVSGGVADVKILGELGKKSFKDLPERIKGLTEADLDIYPRKPVDVIARILGAQQLIRTSINQIPHRGTLDKERVEEVVSISRDNADGLNRWSRQ